MNTSSENAPRRWGHAVKRRGRVSARKHHRFTRHAAPDVIARGMAEATRYVRTNLHRSAAEIMTESDQFGGWVEAVNPVRRDELAMALAVGDDGRVRVLVTQLSAELAQKLEAAENGDRHALARHATLEEMIPVIRRDTRRQHVRSARRPMVERRLSHARTSRGGGRPAGRRAVNRSSGGGDSGDDSGGSDGPGAHSELRFGLYLTAPAVLLAFPFSIFIGGRS